jgi:hypothetical protein
MSSCIDHKNNKQNQIQNCGFKNTDQIFWSKSNKVLLDTAYNDYNGDSIRIKIYSSDFVTSKNSKDLLQIELELTKQWRNNTLSMERIVGDIPLNAYQYYFETLRDSVLPKSMDLNIEKPYSNLKLKNCNFRFYSNKLTVMGFYETRAEVYLN